MKPKVLHSNTPQFRRFLASMLGRRAQADPRVDKIAAEIISSVRRRGDRSLFELTRRLDGVKLGPSNLRVSPDEMEAARNGLEPAQRRALELAARRIRQFHRRTVEEPFTYRDREGMRLGQLVQPLRRVGIYVPGGLGAYPSTVLMNAIAAKVAGVPEVVMVSPPAVGGDSKAVLAAAAIAQVQEFYRIGGAQAVAALAFGTDSIRPVDKIVGPGNAFVQAAKRMVYGVVDIDKIAGPSEVLVIADQTARPGWVAADLIAQAEHGSGDESAIMLTPSPELAQQTAIAVERALADLPRAQSVRRVLGRRSAIVVVADLEEAFDLANRIAPEHLELEVRNPGAWLNRVRAAGAVFLGGLTPAPLGDYVAGPNHVLPTGGAAAYSSPLGAYDFVRRTSIIEASHGALEKLGPAVARLARMEGFEGHARAVELRLKRAAGMRDTNADET